MPKSKKFFFAAVAVIALTAVILLIAGFASAKSLVKLDSEAARISYIENLGYTVKSVPPAVNNIIIPVEFSDIYENYNALQREAGFDLLQYRGEYAVTYSYDISNYTDANGDICDNVRITLILWNDYIIGGDIASTELGGFMTGLCR